MFKEKLKKYAKLIVEVGINPNKGQKLMIACPVECAEFGRLCAEAAYEAGCGEVIMNWGDDHITRLKYLHAEDSVFTNYPAWQKTYFTDMGREGVAKLSIYATDPENLKGVDPNRIASYQKAAGVALEEYRAAQMKNAFPWCVVSVPVMSWAKKVFPEDNDQTAYEKLWDAILTSARVDDNDAVENWKNHIKTLSRRKQILNGYSFKYLRYKNSLGTDLTVELPKDHLWEAGGEKAGTGQTFVPNIPTEEIFTSPKRDGVNGVIFASRPLVLDGNIVEDIKLVLKDGKITEVFATKGLDALKNAISVDEGASYLGEVALVPYNSPISNSGILFYNTLFDENAACHFAFGDSYPTLKGAENMSVEELKSAGLNSSITHEDFMIGTKDLSIVGITEDGREVTVFIDGNFAF